MHWLLVNVLDYVQYWTNSVPSHPPFVAYGCRPPNVECTEMSFVVTQDTPKKPIALAVILNNKEFVSSANSLEEAHTFYQEIMYHYDWIPLNKNELTTLGIGN